MEENERFTYSVEEAAKLLGVSRSLVYECVRTGEIQALKVRRRIIIPKHVIDSMLLAA